MLNPTKITVTTSTEGLGDLPANLYAETCTEMLQHYFEGVEVEVEVADRYSSTEIEIEPAYTGDDYDTYKAHQQCEEQVGRILQDAFDAACSRA